MDAATTSERYAPDRAAVANGRRDDHAEMWSTAPAGAGCRPSNDPRRTDPWEHVSKPLPEGSRHRLMALDVALIDELVRGGLESGWAQPGRDTSDGATPQTGPSLITVRLALTHDDPLTSRQIGRSDRHRWSTRDSQRHDAPRTGRMPHPRRAAVRDGRRARVFPERCRPASVDVLRPRRENPDAVTPIATTVCLRPHFAHEKDVTYVRR